MNITPSNPNRPAAGQASEAGAPSKPEPPAAPAPKGPGGPAGGVELSPGAQAFLRLRNRLDNLPANAHEDRVASLQAAVEAGTHRVSNEQIANAMLRDPATKSLLGLDQRT